MPSIATVRLKLPIASPLFSVPRHASPSDDPVDRVVAAEWVEVGVERSWGRNTKREITRNGNGVLGEITRRVRRLDSRAEL